MKESAKHLGEPPGETSWRVVGARPLAREIQFATAFFVSLAAGFAFSRMAIRTLQEPDVWRTGDFLINYSDGFVRRGLTGQFALLASDLLGVSPVSIVVILQGVGFTTFVLAALGLFLSGNRSLWASLAFASPAFILFHLWDFGGGFRKEVLLLGVFGCLMLWSKTEFKSRFARAVFVGLWPLSLGIIGLAHEGLVFFGPILFVALAGIYREKGWELRGLYWALASGIACSSFVVIASVNASGSPSTAENVCRNLTGYGLDEGVCEGSILALGWSSDFAHQLAIGTPKAVYIPAFLMSIIPFVFFSLRSGLLWAVFVSSLSVTPLFAIGSDWGRWIHVIIALLTLTALRFPNGFASCRRLNVQALSPISNLMFIPVLIVFSTSWHLPHSGGNTWESQVFQVLGAIGSAYGELLRLLTPMS